MPSSTILHKRNSSPGAVPAAGSIQVGELAINTGDGTIFLKTTAGDVKRFSNDTKKGYILNESLSSIAPEYGDNNASGVFSTILNGISNDVSGAGSTIGNGENISVSADYAFVGSGANNVATASADFGGIFAGQNNLLQHQNSFILGSDITSHAENFTYVQNLSVIGSLYVGGSSVNGGAGGGGSSSWETITNKPTTLSGYGITDAAPATLTTFVSDNSANWSNVYTNVNSNSATYATRTYVHTNFLPVTGGTVTGNITATAYYGDGSQLTGIVAGDTAATNLVRSASGNWSGVYTTVNTNSANWNSTRTTVNTNSANWSNVYTAYNSASGSYATKSYVHSNFLPLTGGSVTNGLSAEHLIALSSFAAIGFGALEDTPTFYVGVSVVGINTEYPNEALTVVGNISATGNIYSADTEVWNGTNTTVSTNSSNWGNAYTNVNSNSANWNGVRTTVNTNSAKWENVYTSVNSNSANWNGARTTVNTNSAKWENVYTNVNSNSASWQSVYTSYLGASGTYVSYTYLHTNFLPLTGGNIVGNISATKFYGDGSELTGIVAGDTEATTLVRTNSSNWNEAYTAYSGASSSYATKDYTHANFLPLSGGTLTGTLTGTNVLLTGTLEISGSDPEIPALYVSNNGEIGVNTKLPNHAVTVIGSISATGTLYGDNVEIGGNSGATTVFVGSSSVGINTETPLATLDVSGSNIRISETKTPAGSGADGVQGEICWDSDYLYVCVATNTWKRTTLQSW